MPFKKVCLPSSKDSKPKPGKHCWITGWTKGLKKRLKAVSVHVMKPHQCQEYTG